MAERGSETACRDHGDVARMLRCFRQRKLWTQAALSAHSNVPEKTISALESGARKRPHLSTLEMLADALKLDGDDRAALTMRRSRTPDAPVARDLALPLPATSFLGRRDALAQLETLLRAPETRLVTLTGAGGIGKTRLGLQGLPRIASAFPDGVHFVDLSAITDPDLVPKAIAQGIGFAHPGTLPIEEALIDHCADRRMIVLLDNFEQVLTAATYVDRLLAGAERLTIVVTSRERLQLAREQVFLVAPLSLPAAGETSSAALASTSESVQLFLERSRAVQPSFTLNETNADDVVAICAALDGLPLAIELAAARIAHVGSPRYLRERLDRRLAWLSTNLRDQTARHRTMRDAIDWSYEVLSPAEQALFQRLAIFSGGFSIDAAEALIDLEPDLLAELQVANAEPVLDGIASLVDKNLLQLYDGPDGGTRYRMLETIREYGVERLIAAPDHATVCTNHAWVYLDVVEEGETALTGPNQGGWMARLEAEHDNIRAALRWSIDHSQTEPALRMSAALWRFWAASGRLQEGRDWSQQAVEVEGEAFFKVRAKALNNLGNIESDLGNYVAARDAHQKCLNLRRLTDDPAAIADSLNNLGVALGYIGEYDRARTMAEEALAIRKTLPSCDFPIMTSLFVLGDLDYSVGKYSSSRDLLQEAYAIASRLNSTSMIGYASYYLGRTVQRIDSTKGQNLLAESLATLRAVSDKQGIAYALCALGCGLLAEGEIEAAATHLSEALSMSYAFAGMPCVVECVESLAKIQCLRSESWAAARLFGASFRLRDKLQTPLTLHDKEHILHYVGLVKMELGERDWNRAIAETVRMSTKDIVDEAKTASILSHVEPQTRRCGPKFRQI